MDQGAAQAKYLLYVAVIFTSVLIIANTIAVKLFIVGPFAFAAGIVLFPISYIFGDILTEVYGYRASRKVIWTALGALLLMSAVYYIVQLIPPADFWPHQEAYEAILGVVPRIVLGSILGFFAGEFVNSYVLSKMKIWTEGRHLWMRTIGSTVAGEGVDSIIFFTVAFAGVVPFGALITLIWSGYLVKVLYEVMATPLTYKAVNWLKRAEGMDTYDKGVDYNPFHLRG